MHSKWQIESYLKINPKGISPNEDGLHTFFTYDPLIIRFIKDSFSTDMFNGSLTTLSGKEVSENWLEDNFCSMGLFGNSDSFFIHNAESLSSNCQEVILNNDLILESRHFILSFESKSPFYKKIIKKNEFNHIEIEPPKFWETAKLLDFFADQLRVYLSYQAKNKILNSVNHTCQEFFNTINILNLNFPSEKEISVQMVEEVLNITKIDKFQLAETYSLKKQNEFFKQIIGLEMNFEVFRSLFNFMQSHLIKLIDPSYTNKKNYLTKYDKQIVNCSKLWTKKELQHEIQFFENLEVMCKRKSFLLEHSIKSAYLNSF